MSENTETRTFASVARHWGGQVELIRQRDVDGARVLLWDAHSDQDHAPVAAGAIRMPARTGEDTGAWWQAESEQWALRRLAFGIRDLLQEATGDRSICVTVADQHDDGAGDAAAWGRRGVAEANEPVWFCAHHGEEGNSWDDDEFCSGCHPDWVAGGLPQSDPKDDEDQDDEGVDPEVINELESLAREDDEEE